MVIKKYFYKIKTHKGAYYAYVADPAARKVKYTQEEFSRCWISSVDEKSDVGIALLLEPTPDFYNHEEEKAEKKGFKFLFSYLRPYKGFIFQLILGLIFGSLLQLIMPSVSRLSIMASAIKTLVLYGWF